MYDKLRKRALMHPLAQYGIAPTQYLGKVNGNELFRGI
jgi:hypothetical protein